MNLQIPAAAITYRRWRPAVRGFTLLEVLVSLGIIIGALGGIAALLPAAGSRLAEATQLDRAATMAANARADILNRGLARYDLWQQATGTTANTLAIVFGEGLTVGGTDIAMTGAANVIALAGTAALQSRIDTTTGFQLRDVVQTTLTDSAVITGTGYEPGICYGCMLSSTIAPWGRGSPMRMTTVVFRSPAPEAKEFKLTPRGGVYDIDVARAGADVAADRRRFLAGCSWILVVGVGEPQWCQIASSWTAGTAGLSSLTLSNSNISGPLTAFGFEGLLRIDERFVNLE